MLSQSCHAELVEASSKANAGGKILRFAQDDKKGTFCPSMGSKLPATFANIPTWGG